MGSTVTVREFTRRLKSGKEITVKGYTRNNSRQTTRPTKRGYIKQAIFRLKIMHNRVSSPSFVPDEYSKPASYYKGEIKKYQSSLRSLDRKRYKKNKLARLARAKKKGY